MWKTILKVDEIVFNEGEGLAWFDPSTDKITLNLSAFKQMGLGEGDEDKIELLLEQIIIHESAHQAVHQAMGKKIALQMVDALGQAIVDALNGKSGWEADMDKAIADLIEHVALDEAYAYSTGATISEGKVQINVMESVHSSIMDSIKQLGNQILNGLQRNLPRNEDGKTFFMNTQNNLNTLLKEIQRRLLNKSAKIEGLTRLFVGEMQGLEEDDLLEYVKVVADKLDFARANR
jgi:fructose-specific component phosphotransferase system IIB-like protein